MVASPFDFIKAASELNGNAVLEGTLDAKEMNRFMFLRGLGYMKDGILFADYFQRCQHIPNDLLFTCMHQLIQPKNKRFAKWPKQPKEFTDEQIAFVVDEVRCSYNDAIDVLRSLDEKQLASVLEHLEGAKKEKAKRKNKKSDG